MNTPIARWLVALALLTTVSSCGGGCSGSGATSPEPTAAPARLDLPVPIAPLPEATQRGVCLAHNWQLGGINGYGSDDSLESKKELVRLGVRWVSLTPFAWQKSVTSARVGYDPEMVAGENDDRLTREIQQARQLGLKVMLKPHIWINHSEWRGHIEPDPAEGGWDTWFATYSAFILHHARLAEEHQVDAFVIGVELASSSRSQRARWVALIDAARAAYSGPITYAANWNEAEQVVFWDKLDWIGVQFFAPLTDQLDPSYAELEAGVERQLRGYEALSVQHDKPVVFTEFGFKAIRATALSPGTWPEHLPDEAKRYDERSQALAYAAVLNVAAQKPWLRGLYVWKWFTDVDTDEEGPLGFSPRRREAARVLSRAFGP